jgi:diketogulonate reductase-like aldo/keto reductase
MSWSTSYTGQTSPFNDRQRIGLTTSCSTPAATIDLVNTAVHHDIRTFNVSAGDELAVRSAVDDVCQRKEVNESDFRYVITLTRQDHAMPELISSKLETIMKKLNVTSLYMVLVPYPVEPKKSDEEPYSRKQITSQTKTARKTWDTLTNLVTLNKITFLGLNEFSNDQIEGLVQPSPPVVAPSIRPSANWFTVSPWKSSMDRVNYNHSRGIQVLCRLIHDHSVVSATKGSVDERVEKIRASHDNRTARQIISLWAIDRGLVVFPDIDDIRTQTDTSVEGYDRFRVLQMNTIQEITLLLNPLFRKKPMWKNAFALEADEYEQLDGLDEDWNRRKNEKLMSGKFVWNAKKNNKKEEDKEDKEGWEDEYREYYDNLAKEKAAEEKVIKDAVVARNVETDTRVKVFNETFEHGDKVEFMPRKLAQVGRSMDDPDQGVTVRSSPKKDKSPVREEKVGEGDEESEGAEEEDEEEKGDGDEVEHSKLSQFFTEDVKIL